MKAKPDCTGQRFGMLLVLGKGGKIPDRNSYRQLWQAQCDCGTIVELPRGYFECNGQVSCGCKRRRGLVDNNRRPKDITGKRFGNLTAIELTGKKHNSKPTWFLRCDCGGIREMSLTQLGQGNKLNCGAREHLPGSWYPPAPNPYPTDAGKILKKYLPLTELKYRQIDSAVEDERRDRLIRAAWIITYRKQQGEIISELHVKRIIYKHLRYCSIDVFWKRKLETNGGFLYNASGNKKSIGNTMTDVISNDYPVIETQGIKLLTVKRKKFLRC